MIVLGLLLPTLLKISYEVGSDDSTLASLCLLDDLILIWYLRIIRPTNNNSLLEELAIEFLNTKSQLITFSLIQSMNR